MDIAAHGPRYQLAQTVTGIEISMRARRSWFMVLFLLVWLCGWAAGEVAVGTEVLSGPWPPQQSFRLVWLLGWTVGGVYAIVSLLWPLCGREFVSIDAERMVYRVTLLGLRRTRSYAVRDIRHLRAVDYPTGLRAGRRSSPLPLIGAGDGPLAFDYGADSVRMLPSLDEAEARLLVDALKGRLPAAVFH